MTEAPATLADLVSPLAEEEFFALLRRREFAFRSGSTGERYAPLVGWKAFKRMISAGDYQLKRHDDIRVTKESHTIPKEQWATDGKVDAAKLDKFLAQGFSVVALHLEEYVPALGAICDEIKSRTREGTFVGLVITSNAAIGAFKLHYDPEDLIILQVEGTKRWQVFGPPVANPLRGMPKPPAPDSEPIFDEILEPGDMLFVPAGNWHHCECGLSTSVHLGIFFLPPAGWHAVEKLMRPLISEEMFRIPLTRLDDDAALEAMEAEVKSRLVEKIGELKLDDFITGWRKVAY